MGTMFSDHGHAWVEGCPAEPSGGFRVIDHRGRHLGGPTVRAACGGNLSLS
jgi:hypothetical protein